MIHRRDVPPLNHPVSTVAPRMANRRFEQFRPFAIPKAIALHSFHDRRHHPPRHFALNFLLPPFLRQSLRLFFVIIGAAFFLRRTRGEEILEPIRFRRLDRLIPIDHFKHAPFFINHHFDRRLHFTFEHLAPRRRLFPRDHFPVGLRIQPHLPAHTRHVAIPANDLLRRLPGDHLFPLRFRLRERSPHMPIDLELVARRIDTHLELATLGIPLCAVRRVEGAVPARPTQHAFSILFFHRHQPRVVLVERRAAQLRHIVARDVILRLPRRHRTLPVTARDFADRLLSQLFVRDRRREVAQRATQLPARHVAVKLRRDQQ